jgi:hypothetical protein
LHCSTALRQLAQALRVHQRPTAFGTGVRRVTNAMASCTCARTSCTLWLKRAITCLGHFIYSLLQPDKRVTVAVTAGQVLDTQFELPTHAQDGSCSCCTPGARGGQGDVARLAMLYARCGACLDKGCPCRHLWPCWTGTASAVDAAGPALRRASATTYDVASTIVSQTSHKVRLGFCIVVVSVTCRNQRVSAEAHLQRCRGSPFNGADRSRPSGECRKAFKTTYRQCRNNHMMP